MLIAWDDTRMGVQSRAAFAQSAVELCRPHLGVESAVLKRMMLRRKVHCHGRAMSGGYWDWPLADSYLKVFTHQNDQAFFTRLLFTFRGGKTGRVNAVHMVVPKSDADLGKREPRLGIGYFPKSFDAFIRQDRKLQMWHNLN